MDVGEEQGETGVFAGYEISVKGFVWGKNDYSRCCRCSITLGARGFSSAVSGSAVKSL